MADAYGAAGLGGLTAPATRAADITPSDSSDIPNRPRALTVEGSGTVTMTMEDGNDVQVTLISGTVYPLRPLRIKASGTTATGIIGWW